MTRRSRVARRPDARSPPVAPGANRGDRKLESRATRSSRRAIEAEPAQGIEHAEESRLERAGRLPAEQRIVEPARDRQRRPAEAARQRVELRRRQRFRPGEPGDVAADAVAAWDGG